MLEMVHSAKIMLEMVHSACSKLVIELLHESDMGVYVDVKLSKASYM